MAKRSQDDIPDNESGYEEDGPAPKRPRAFMAALACDVCRGRKTRCDEDRPKCGYCRTMNVECTYQTPRLPRKDSSRGIATGSIRRLEAKIERLTTAVTEIKALLPSTTIGHYASLVATAPGISFQDTSRGPVSGYARHDHGSFHQAQISPQGLGSPDRSPYPVSDMFGKVDISFSQHGISLWPTMRDLLPPGFVSFRDTLPKDYIVEIESKRPPLPMDIGYPLDQYPESWLSGLSLSVIKGLSDAFFAVFHRNTPVLDKYNFFSNTLGTAIENDFGCDIETCLVLNVLALGCLAVKAHEEGDFPLPSRFPTAVNVTGFVRPEWYNLIADHPPGLKFFNEARKRFGFLICQNDLQSGQFYTLSTLYYTQILRPIESWSMVNRAALCCMGILRRTEAGRMDFDTWEGDMFSRLFWNTLIYETIITLELNLPLSGLLHHEADIPIPKFTPFARPNAGLFVDDDDSFFNVHFLAQVAHRIILTRIAQTLYSFVEMKGSPSPTLKTEIHHQLEQWRLNLPAPLQFSDDNNSSRYHSPTPAHVIARAMLRSRYLAAKFHIGRPFLYKALHYPHATAESEYDEIREGLRGAMHWPIFTGLCAQLKSALPLKFGFASQCYGQILLFHAVARSTNARLIETLPEGWQEWVSVMMGVIEGCAEGSPGLGKDVELLRLL